MKNALSASELRQLVQDEVDLIPEIIEDNAVVKVSEPHLHQLDSEGRNWNITVVQNGNGYISDISSIIEKYRSLFVLKK